MDRLWVYLPYNNNLNRILENYLQLLMESALKFVPVVTIMVPIAKQGNKTLKNSWL